MTHVSSIRARIRRMFKSEDGAATVELAIVFPFFVAIFVSSFEIASMNIRAVMLERAVDQAVREVRLNPGGNIPYGQVLNSICSQSFMIPNCKQTVKIELREVLTTSFAIPGPQSDCIDRSAKIQPPANFVHGADNALMLMRVCAVVDPFFPLIGVGRSMPKDKSGGYQVIASSAFVNEPQ